MKIELELDPNLNETVILIRAKELTPEISDLVNRFKSAGTAADFLIAYKDDRIHLIKPESIVRIFTDNQRVLLETDDTQFILRNRLYEIEERLTQPNLIRISNSEIVNFNKVANLDLSLSGTICIVFNNGNRSFVSRRYMPRIKQYLQI